MARNNSGFPRGTSWEVQTVGHPPPDRPGEREVRQRKVGQVCTVCTGYCKVGEVPGKGIPERNLSSASGESNRPPRCEGRRAATATNDKGGGRQGRVGKRYSRYK